MQGQAMEDVPYLGQVLVPMVRRASMTGMLNGFLIFWNVAPE